MSLEGRMLWLLRSSPLDVKPLFWCKYWVGTLPLLRGGAAAHRGHQHRCSSVSPFVLVAHHRDHGRR